MATTKTHKLAAALRTEFKQKGWSMNELSKRSDVPFSCVHRFFSAGYDNADLNTVERWCGVLGLELSPIRGAKKKG